MPKFKNSRHMSDPETAGICSCGAPEVLTTQYERLGDDPEFVCQITCLNCGRRVDSTIGLQYEDQAAKSAKEKWLSKTSGDLKAKAAVLREESDKMWARAKKVDNILKGVQ